MSGRSEPRLCWFSLFSLTAEALARHVTPALSAAGAPVTLSAQATFTLPLDADGLRRSVAADAQAALAG